MATEEEMKENRKKYLKCCIGVVIVLAVLLLLGNMFGPRTVAEDAAPMVNVTTDDVFTYYADDTLQGKAGYNLGVKVDGEEYYFTDADMGLFCDYSPYVNLITVYDAKKSEPAATITDPLGIPRFNVYQGGSDTERFDFKVDVPFGFSYHDGVTVGKDDNAKVIDDLFVNGTKV